MGNSESQSAAKKLADSSKGIPLSNIAKLRIKNELKDIQDNPPANWRVIVVDERTWSIWITAEVILT
jgi:ubiquitin-protein ligase